MAKLVRILVYVGVSVVLSSVVVSRLRHAKRSERRTRSDFQRRHDHCGLGLISRLDSGCSRSSSGKNILQSSRSGKHLLQRKLQPTANPLIVVSQNDMFYLNDIAWFSDGLVQAWNDPVQQNAARNAVPIEIRKAIWDAQHTKRPPDGSAPEYDAIRKLMKWFRYEFMQWLQLPICEGKDCKDKKPVRSSKDDYTVPPRINKTSNTPFEWSSYNVNVFKCPGCKQDIHLPRYNDPERLLKYHTGRCGEHSSLFAFICLALGLDARVIKTNDFDHVWTEVYFKSINRWIHCDPSEDQLDTPLMYELGGCEKINTIIAYSTEEVRDVTRRYTHDYKMIKNHRTMLMLSILPKYIEAANEKRQKNLPKSRREELKKREKEENEQLMLPVNLDITNSARISSSLEQMKSDGKVRPDILQEEGSTWEFDEEDMKRNKFYLRYDCVSDNYDRNNTGQNSKVGKWYKGVSSAESIQRIMEDDLKTCYLTRLEGAPKSSISWKFQFSKKVKEWRIDQVKITLPTENLSLNAYLTVTVFSENHVYLHWPVLSDGKFIYDFETDKFKGETGIWMKIVMAGGDWDATRLFTSSQGNEKTFDVEITLTNKSCKPKV